jgi:hypothetical protein
VRQCARERFQCSRARRRSLVRPRRDHYLRNPPQQSSDRAATAKFARGRHPDAGRPRKPKRPAQKPPRSLTASASCSSAGAALGQTAPRGGSRSLTLIALIFVHRWNFFVHRWNFLSCALAAHDSKFRRWTPGNVKLLGCGRGTPTLA